MSLLILLSSNAKEKQITRQINGQIAKKLEEMDIRKDNMDSNQDHQKEFHNKRSLVIKRQL